MNVFLAMLLALGAQPAGADPDQLLKTIAGYQFGQDRAELLAMEKLVASASHDAAAGKALAAKLAAVLATNATPDCKQFVCRQLSLIGSAAEVPALARWLDDKDLAFFARFALERIPGDESLAALRGALKTATGKRRVGLINSLAARRDPQAIPAIVSTIAGTDPETAAAAIRALGSIGGTQALAALLAAEAGVPAELRPQLAAALLRCAEDLRSTGHAQEALPILEKLCAADRPRVVRVAAMIARAAALGEQGDPLILAALAGTDKTMQAAAVRAARASGGSGLLRTLAERLPGLAPPMQPQVIALLADRREVAALPAVTRAACSKDPAVHRAAIAAWGSLGNAATVPMLLALVDWSDKDERKIVGESLSRLRGPGVDEALATALANSGPDAQREIIRAIVARSAKGAVPALLATAEGRDAAIAREAIAALGKLADAKEGPRVIALLDKAADRAAAEAALMAIFRRAERLDPLIAALAAAPAARKASLLRVLSSLGGSEALAAVRKVLKSEEAHVRKAAARALADWPDAAALDDLLSVAATTEDATSKVLALRGVARLVPLAKDRPPERLTELVARAISLCQRKDEIKLLLSALANIPHLSGVKVALPYLKDPALKDEAALAVVEIAEGLGSRQRGEVAAALEVVKAVCDNPAILVRAGLIPLRENLARGATATNPDGLAADGAAGGPQAAIDGNPATYWDEVDYQKLYQLRVQLKRPATVNLIRIVGYAQHNFAPKDFEILCDGKVVKTVRNAQYQKNLFTVDLPPTRCTTLELKITSYYGGSPGIRELEIYGNQDEDRRTP